MIIRQNIGNTSTQIITPKRRVEKLAKINKDKKEQKFLAEKAPRPKEIKGHFTIEAYDKNGNVIDSYEDDNLVVNSARYAMGALLAGKPDAVSMSRFVLGTRGHDTTANNILVAKAPGKDGYDESRTKLFSEEENTSFFYTISWDTSALKDSSGQIVPFDKDEVEFIAVGQQKNHTGNEPTAENAKIPMKISISNNTLLYEWTIPEKNANGINGKSTIGYTEAALKCGDTLFSIKCFPAKVKELSVMFKIKWKIIF